MKAPLRVPAKTRTLLMEAIIRQTGIVFTIARILLGLIFGVLGMNGFVPFIKAPPPTGMALQFAVLLFTSHYNWVIFGTQVICGVMLLTNRYVPLALVVLAAVIVNIFTYHITMYPQGLFPMPLLVLVLWFIVAWPFRGDFAALFSKKVA